MRNTELTLEECMEGLAVASLWLDILGEEYENTKPSIYLIYYDGTIDNAREALADEIYDCYAEIGYYFRYLAYLGYTVEYV